ncbi:MAG TPA: succinate dehydrogenase assembly factor 2 [Gammaproteobacteria bacterium]|nr:succinate dehydrogenase assembly factor 2 [Gammaproteobacteria bacterium]
MSDVDFQQQKNRLHWQCRRGMLELDDLLQGFLHSGFDELNNQECEYFEQLLTCPDNLLLEYLMGRTVPADPNIADVVRKIRTAAQA